MNTERILIEINCLPAMREALADWLLERDSLGFTVFDVRGHGSNAEALTLGEQVQGSQKRVQFQLERDAGEWPGFAENLRARFGTAEIYVRVSPVLYSLHLSQK